MLNLTNILVDKIINCQPLVAEDTHTHTHRAIAIENVENQYRVTKVSMSGRWVTDIGISVTFCNQHLNLWDK